MSSGLFVASKYPVLDAEFFPFTQVFMPLKKSQVVNRFLRMFSSVIKIWHIFVIFLEI